MVYLASSLDCKMALVCMARGKFSFVIVPWESKFLSRLWLSPWRQIVKDGRETGLDTLDTKKVVWPESKSINPKIAKTKKAEKRLKWISFLIGWKIRAKVQLVSTIWNLKCYWLISFGVVVSHISQTLQLAPIFHVRALKNLSNKTESNLSGECS